MAARRGGDTNIKALLRRKLVKCPALPLLLLSALLGRAAAQELPVVHYGSAEGLPSIFILALTQDELGRLWVAHHAGLSMYDGSRFQTWSRAEGLLDNSPSMICADGNGSVWAAFPDRGIQYVTLEGYVMTVAPSRSLCRKDRIAFLFRMRDGSMMAAGRLGYYRLSKMRMEGPFYPLPGKQGRVTYALDAGEKLGTLLACQDGLFSMKGPQAELVPLPYNKLGSRDISLVCSGPENTLYALARNGKLIRWDGKEHKIWDLAPLSRPLTNAFFEMQPDRRGEPWIATGDGLFHLNGDTLELFSEAHGLSNVWVNHLLIDREGVLWLGTEGGLDKVSHFMFRNIRHHENFPVNSVWPIEELSDGSIWIGTNSGILILKPDGRTRLITKNDGLPENAVVDLEAGPRGTAWVLTYNGICYWNGTSFISYPQEAFVHLGLWTILPVKPNEIWVTTSDGIYILDPGHEAIYRHPLNDQIEGARDLNNLISRSNGEVFIVGRKLHVWRPGGRVEEIPLPAWAADFSLYDVIEDSPRLWVVADEGLMRLEAGNWTWFPLEGKKAFVMVKVRDGEFWVGCSSGIASFDGKHFEYFDLQDGVAVEECNTGSKLLDSRGRVWLGGKNITLILPEHRTAPPVGKPLITRAVAGSRSYLLPVSMEMSSRTRSLEIQYTTPSFFNEHKLLHRTRMKPLEKGFSQPTAEKSIRYANLAPGRYNFIVQAGRQNGTWPESETSLDVLVKPTFWQTRTPQVFFLLFLVAGGIFLSSARVRFLEKQRAKLQRTIDTQTEKIKNQRDEMAKLAALDPLTNLANRRKFMECLEAEIARVKRTLRPLSILMMDIDHFKTINDSCGHAAGDEVLRGMAERSLLNIREMDTLARWGGDEFILLMPETNLDQARETARRMKAGIQTLPLVLSDGRSLDLTFSGGLVSWDIGKEAGKTADTLLQEADTLLYRAKNSGRDRIDLAVEFPRTSGISPRCDQGGIPPWISRRSAPRGKPRGISADRQWMKPRGGGASEGVTGPKFSS